MVGLSADGDIRQDSGVGLRAPTNDGMGRTSWTSTMPNQHQCKLQFFPVIQTTRNLAVPSWQGILKETLEGLVKHTMKRQVTMQM